MIAVVCVCAVHTAEAIPVSGLQLWLKADAGVTKVGNSVTGWTDQSGGTVYTLTQATASKQPTFEPNWHNGRPAVRFDGLNDYLVDLTSTLDLTSGLSIFVVAENSVRQNFNGVFKVAQPASGPEGIGAYVEVSWEVGSSSAGSGNVVFNVDRSVGGQFNFQSGANAPPPAGEPYLYDVISSGLASEQRTQGVVRSSQATSLNPASPSLPSGAGNPMVGMAIATQGPLNGYISEVLVYDRAVTAAERDEIYAYLEQRLIPEPATLLIAGVGSALLILRRRRAT
jgi:hypothetical protein